MFRDGIGVAWFDGEKDVTWGRGSKNGGFGRDVLSEKKSLKQSICDKTCYDCMGTQVSRDKVKSIHMTSSKWE